MSDLDEIRRKRMAELEARQAAAQGQMQQQAQQQMQQQEAQRQFEEQKKALIAQILTTEARSRLANLKLTKPELVNQIEIQLIQSAQAGSLRGKVTDEQLKVLLRQIAGQKREIKITPTDHAIETYNTINEKYIKIAWEKLATIKEKDKEIMIKFLDYIENTI